MAVSVLRVSPEALPITSVARPTSEPISATEPVSSSAALATVCTLREVDCETFSAAEARSLAAEATVERSPAALVIPPRLSRTVSSMLLTLASNVRTRASTCSWRPVRVRCSSSEAAVRRLRSMALSRNTTTAFVMVSI